MNTSFKLTESACVALANDRCVAVPEIGLELRVRTPQDFAGSGLELIETINAPGFGPPLHKHREAEIFYVLQGAIFSRSTASASKRRREIPSWQMATCRIAS
jgi:hypothetical protein